jgi:hypothetical protein
MNPEDAKYFIDGESPNKMWRKVFKTGPQSA